MRIYKFIHSCLVFEDNGFKLLFDPGKFTFAEGQVKPNDFADVNAIIISHIHHDHLDTDNLKTITGLSNAKVYANSQVGEALQKEGIAFELMEQGKYTVGPFTIDAFEVQHEPLLNAPIPQMTGYIINGKILHPIDSMEAKLTKIPGIELLLMVTMAPFANELRIAGFADTLKPKQILPVHDGYVKEFFLRSRYDNYARYFEKAGIQFHQVYKPGDYIEF